MTILKCDKCGKEIPIITKKILGKEVKFFDTGKVHLNEWNANNLFIDYDLCKQCANEISMAFDYELLKYKTEALKTV